MHRGEREKYFNFVFSVLMTAEMRSNHLKALAAERKFKIKEKLLCFTGFSAVACCRNHCSFHFRLAISLPPRFPEQAGGRPVGSSAEHISLPAAKLLEMKRNEAKQAFVRSRRKREKHACSHERPPEYPLLATVSLLFLFHFHQKVMKQFSWLLPSRCCRFHLPRAAPFSAPDVTADHMRE